MNVNTKIPTVIQLTQKDLDYMYNELHNRYV